MAVLVYIMSLQFLEEYPRKIASLWRNVYINNQLCFIWQSHLVEGTQHPPNERLPTHQLHVYVHYANYQLCGPSTEYFFHAILTPETNIIGESWNRLLCFSIHMAIEIIKGESVLLVHFIPQEFFSCPTYLMFVTNCWPVMFCFYTEKSHEWHDVTFYYDTTF